MAGVSKARQAALEAITRCRRDGAWSGDTLDAVLKRGDLDRRDAALASRLCLGVLQNETLCDHVIAACCSTGLEPKVRDTLRLGVYQLLFLDRVPARAAVSETVELCRASGCGRAAGLVNAVLRRVSALNALPEIPGEGTAQYLAVRYSHPLWFCEYLSEKKGYAFAETFLAADNEPAKLSIQVNTLKVRTEDYIRSLERLGIAFRVMEPDGCLQLEGGLLTDLPGFDEGLFYVQDRAARIAAEIACAEAGMRVLDACACPGGKSFASAIRMGNQGAILACDLREKKLSTLEKGAERLGIGIIETRAADARSFDPTLAASFDVVIADVPCSGFGVIAKKPEIRWKDPESLRALPQIQYAILDNLSRYVKEGGVLLYATCTVLSEENEAVARRFLDEHGEYGAEGFILGEIRSEDGMYTFWPNTDGTDGFFVAKFRKNT